jgi:Uma2 family endonuclease
MATKLRVPLDDYLAMPEDEAPYHEYVDGEVIQKAMPDLDHMALVDELADAIRAYRRRFGGHSGGEGRTQFVKPNADPDYRLPDYAYWLPDAPSRVLVRGRRYGHPPTLAIEVRSPDETMRNQREKCRYYRRNGVHVCWLVDPGSRTVEVFDDMHDGVVLRADDTLESRLLPGFSLALSDLFAVLDED